MSGVKKYGDSKKIATFAVHILDKKQEIGFFNH